MRARKILLALGAASAFALSQQAGAQSDRTVLPVPPPEFTGATIREDVTGSTPIQMPRLAAPKDAPNLFVFMADDVGFAMSSTFGGPVPTPNMDRLAASGQRHNRFHTTGICAPSRAALLTGRNHHRVGAGYQPEFAIGYPGYTGRISPAAATVAQTLRLNGYSTAMFGKHHNVPAGENTSAGPFDYWPTGLGFEYFFGFIGGATNQWHPNLMRGTSRVADPPGPPELLDKRLADDAIDWLRNQRANASNRPFFVYMAPASVHAPHQAPAGVIAGFKGRFDMGWDRMREESLGRQIAAEIVPRGTRLTPRPEQIPAWSALTNDQKFFAAREMEVAAAMLAYQDEQLGRVIDEMERMGVLANTLLIVVQGDNGGSAEAGPRGAVNERSELNGTDESDQWRASIVDELGGDRHNSNYPAGWAWAMNTPLRWTKQYASMLGGIRNGMIVSWQGHVASPGSICARFGHLVDIAPTLLDAAQLPRPVAVYGVRQMPFDGESLLPSLSSCNPGHPRTQYFEMAGKIGLYHDGLFASFDDGRAAWQTVATAEDKARARWTLYDLTSDFSQSNDISKARPADLQKMIALWQAVARSNHVFPLDGRSPVSRGAVISPRSDRLEFWGEGTSINAGRLLANAGQPFTLEAELDLGSDSASGVIAALGSRIAGWTLYLDRGRPVFVHARSSNTADVVRISADRTLPAGKRKLRLIYAATGPRKSAEVTLLAGGDTIARLHIPADFVMTGESSETLDIGRDIRLPVTDYPFDPARFDGQVLRMSIDVPPPAAK